MVDITAPPLTNNGRCRFFVRVCTLHLDKTSERTWQQMIPHPMKIVVSKRITYVHGTVNNLPQKWRICTQIHRQTKYRKCLSRSKLPSRIPNSGNGKEKKDWSRQDVGRLYSQKMRARMSPLLYGVVTETEKAWHSSSGDNLKSCHIVEEYRSPDGGMSSCSHNTWLVFLHLRRQDHPSRTAMHLLCSRIAACAVQQISNLEINGATSDLYRIPNRHLIWLIFGSSGVVFYVRLLLVRVFVVNRKFIAHELYRPHNLVWRESLDLYLLWLSSDGVVAYRHNLTECAKEPTNLDAVTRRNSSSMNATTAWMCQAVCILWKRYCLFGQTRK